MTTHRATLLALLVLAVGTAAWYWYDNRPRSIRMACAESSRSLVTPQRAEDNLSVYLASSTSEVRAAEVRQELLARPDVEAVELVSRAERLNQLRRTQGSSDLINEAMEALGENPFGPGLIVTARSLEGYAPIVAFLSSDRFSTTVEDIGSIDATLLRIAIARDEAYKRCLTDHGLAP